MDRPHHPGRPALRRSLLLWPLLSLLVFAGCATTPVLHRTHPSAAARATQLRTVVAPLDAELSELTAGGLLEPRDDWTELAVQNLAAALAAETQWTPPVALTDEQLALVQAETEDVQALVRAFTLNHLMATFPVRGPFAIPEGNLTYNTGPLTAHADALGEGAVLFVFVRNSYATAGRKALLAFSLIGAGLTGVAIIPAMGSDIVSAALVETDGTVLWFNVHAAGADPRTPEGARALAKQILVGLPRATAS